MPSILLADTPQPFAERRAARGNLKPLLAEARTVRQRAVSRCLPELAAGFLEHVVVTDDEQRPVGILTPKTLMRGDVAAPLVADAAWSPQTLARVVADGDHDLTLPMVVTDGGRVVGTLTTKRLLAHLAQA